MGVQPLSAPEILLICAVFGPEVVIRTSILKPGPGPYSTLAILPPMTASDRRTTYVYVPARSTETAPLCAAGTPGGTWCRTTSPRSLGHLCSENSPTTPSASARNKEQARGRAISPQWCRSSNRTPSSTSDNKVGNGSIIVRGQTYSSLHHLTRQPRTVGPLSHVKALCEGRSGGPEPIDKTWLDWARRYCPTRPPLPCSPRCSAPEGRTDILLFAHLRTQTSNLSRPMLRRGRKYRSESFG